MTGRVWIAWYTLFEIGKERPEKSQFLENVKKNSAIKKIN